MMTDKSMDFLEKQGSSATKALEVLREELPSSVLWAKA